MRPSLSLAVLPALSALVALPVSAASSSSSSAVEVEAPPPSVSLSLSLSQRFPSLETVKKAAKRLRRNRGRGRSEEEVFFHWVDSEEDVDCEEDVGFEEGAGLDEEEERRREEEEEREMWRGLLGGLNGKEGGEVSEMFRELVAGGPGGGEGQVVFSPPDLPSSSFSSSSSSPPPASLSPFSHLNSETESPHVAPPPSLLPPPTIPDEAEYHVPPHSAHEAETFRSLHRKIRLLAGATVEGFVSLLRPVPFSLPLLLPSNNRTISSLSTLPRPSLSLVHLPLETLKTRLPPSFGLTFVLPGGAGGMSK